MPKARVNDINIYYEVHGTGEPLVLISGLAARGESFSYQLPALAEHFQTIIFDNRGVGETDQPRQAYSLAQMADDTAGLLNALNIASAHVYGVSMGGMIAQELILKHPRRVGKLALGCTHSGIKHCIPSPQWVRDIFRNAKGKTREQLVRECIPVNFAPHTIENNPTLVETVVQRMINNKQQDYAYYLQLDAVYGFEAYDRLPEIKAPTLVLTGTEDVLIPPENSRLLVERIPDARLIEFDETGHLFFIEKANQVNQALISFFKN